MQLTKLDETGCQTKVNRSSKDGKGDRAAADHAMKWGEVPEQLTLGWRWARDFEQDECKFKGVSLTR